MIRNNRDKKIKETFKKFPTPSQGNAYGVLTFIIILVVAGLGYFAYREYKNKNVVDEQQFGFKFY